jgi:hypothetical protein
VGYNISKFQYADFPENKIKNKYSKTNITFAFCISVWLLFNVNSAIVQLYHDENKLIFNEMMMIRFALFQNHIGGVVVSMLASSAADRGFKPRSGQTKTMKLVFVASLLSTQH